MATFTDGPGGTVSTNFDTHIRSGSGAEYSGYSYMSLWITARKGLVKFDPTSLAEAAQSLTSASVRFTAYETIPATGTVSLYAILAANSGWVEACNWNYADGASASQRWAGDAADDGGDDAGCSVSGTDYNATPIGSFAVTQNDAAGTQYTASLDLTQFAAWVAGNNYGMVLIPNANNISIATSDHATESYRPLLTVEYTPFPPPGLAPVPPTAMRRMHHLLNR